MSLFDCIETAVGADEIAADRAKVVQELYRELETKYRAEGLDADTAARQAGTDAKRIMREKIARKRFITLKQVQTMRRLKADLDGYKGDTWDALPALLENDHRAGFENVSSVRTELQRRYFSIMNNVIRAHGRTITGGTRNKAGIRNIVREMHGESTGDASAKELASSAKAAMEAARLDFNAAGGDIGHLDDFGLPHSHSPASLIEAGYDAWASGIAPRLDWSRMVDNQTGRPYAAAGGAPDPARVDALLRDIFDAITTEGRSRREPSMQIGTKSLANRNADERVLHFATPDDWIAYNKDFGTSDPFAAIVSHLDRMARDTAVMRVLGPNPNGGLTYAKDLAMRAADPIIQKGGAPAKQAANRADAMGHLAQDMLEHYSGRANIPADGKIAAFTSGVRHLLTAAQLGSAAVAAVTDTGTIAMQAAQIGGIGAGMRAVGKSLRLYLPSNAADRQLADRAGLIMEHLVDVGSSQSRFLGEVYAPEKAERVSSFVMRASFLAQMTTAHRQGFQLEFMGLLADNADHAMADMRPGLRRMLERRGVTADDWNEIRTTSPIHSDRGRGFLNPDHIRRRKDLTPERAEGLALKMGAIMQEQTEYAVPSTTLRGRAQLNVGAPGTIGGELTRSMAMYKSFALSIYFNQLRRRFVEAQTPAGAVGNLALYGAITTLMGAGVVELKDIVKGREPRDPTTGQFWGAALLQGGGLGIFGDFLSASESRFGGGLAETAAGSFVGFGGDLLKLTAGNTLEQFGDSPSNTGREMVNFLRRYTPGGSIWYAQTAYNRMVLDNLQRLVDPEAEKAWRRSERRRVRAYGNESFWSPGESLPGG